MAVSMDLIKQLREETGAGIMDAKRALEESAGNLDKARQLVLERGLAKADKKADRETNEGFIGVYVHTTGKIGAMVSLLCETDFVARNEEFRSLAREIALHAASMQPESVEELMEQEHVRTGEEIRSMVKALSGKVGENITVGQLHLLLI